MMNALWTCLIAFWTLLWSVLALIYEKCFFCSDFFDDGTFEVVETGKLSGGGEFLLEITSYCVFLITSDCIQIKARDAYKLLDRLKSIRLGACRLGKSILRTKAFLRMQSMSITCRKVGLLFGSLFSIFRIKDIKSSLILGIVTILSYVIFQQSSASLWPMKGFRRAHISYKITPIAHTSLLTVYGPLVSSQSNSGAKQNGVPTFVVFSI